MNPNIEMIRITHKLTKSVTECPSTSFFDLCDRYIVQNGKSNFTIYDADTVDVEKYFIKTGKHENCPYAELNERMEADLTRQSVLIGEIRKVLNSGKGFYDIGLEVNTLMSRYEEPTEEEFTECVV